MLPITLYQTIQIRNTPHTILVKHTAARMKCLHGEPCAHSTAQKGSFWSCNQNPSCYFLCSNDESYLYEKAAAAWKYKKQPHPRCEKHGKLAKMHVVKNLLNLTTVDPSSFAPINEILVPSGLGAMCDP